MREVILEEIDSTNTYAKSYIDDFADRTVISAKKQNFGRGRLNRSWVDLGEGNLFMSFVLKPDLKYRHNFSNFTQYLSIVLCKVLENYGVSPKIKWPNDVLVDGKKIAGILAETVMKKDVFKGIVLGIGVNLNSNQTDIDNIPDKVATALNLQVNENIDNIVFEESLINEFYKNYDRFLVQGFEMIKSEYIQRNCFIGKELNIQIFDKVERGFANGVNDNGELLLLNDDKELVLTIGDIL